MLKAGIPWGEVMDMDATIRRGTCIALGMLDGNEFDWNTLQWKPRNG